MNNYVIYTDSACDIPAELLTEWGVLCCKLSLGFTDSEEQYEDGQLDFVDFYEQMRGGRVAKTAAVNVETFKNAFEAEAEKGNDVLYIGFSSGLSNTFNAGRLAAEALSEVYPERKFIAVDSLCASAGEGLLVSLAVEKKKEGADIEALAAYVEKIKPNLCHWFTVDDLVYLKRGGRVSPAAAFFGNALGIKPVLHVDNEGHLVATEKVRGRKMSIRRLVEKLGATMLDPKNGRIFICQGDCQGDVDALEAMLQEKYGRGIDLTVFTGTVIGSHSGPGTLAIFFVGKER